MFIYDLIPSMPMNNLMNTLRDKILNFLPDTTVTTDLIYDTTNNYRVIEISRNGYFGKLILKQSASLYVYASVAYNDTPTSPLYFYANANTPFYMGMIGNDFVIGVTDTSSPYASGWITTPSNVKCAFRDDTLIKGNSQTGRIAYLSFSTSITLNPTSIILPAFEVASGVLISSFSNIVTILNAPSSNIIEDPLTTKKYVKVYGALFMGPL